MRKKHVFRPVASAYIARGERRARGLGWALALLVLMGLACNTTKSTINKSWEKIDGWSIGEWVETDKKAPFFYLWQDGNARHLTLVYSDPQKIEIDLGYLERPFGVDAPLEARFVSFEGVQFIVFWVDQQRLPVPVRSILVERPRTAAPEHSRESKMVEITRKGMAVLPIFPLEQDEWTALAYLALMPRDIDAPTPFRKEFQPPFSLLGRFREVPSSP